jgi:hypothetical protein
MTVCGIDLPKHVLQRHVYTVAEWEHLRTYASIFREVVERDRVLVP